MDCQDAERIVESFLKADTVFNNSLQVAFLAQARTALRLIQDIVPPDERTTIFSFGGIPEMETAVVAIEQFLALPRHRDEETPPSLRAEDGVLSCEQMPEISRFFGIVIRMYFDDHNPPHFHATYAESEARVGIEPIVVPRARFRIVPPRWFSSGRPFIKGI